MSRPRPGALRALAVGLALVLVGCGGGSAARTTTKARGAVRAAPRKSSLPVDQAVTQLFAVGFSGGDERAPVVARLATRDWGMLVLDAGNVGSDRATRRLVRALDAAGAARGRPAPLIAAGDGALPGVPSPPEAQQSTPAAARAAALAAARKLRGLGIGLTFAPVADVGYSAGPAAGLAFSDQPATVAQLTAAATQGYVAGGVAPAPGHFPGQGAASQDPEQGVASVGLPLAALRTSEVVPFAAVAGVAPALRMSDAVYAAWDGITPATLLPEPFDLLRRGLRYAGVAISGDLVAATAATGGSVGAAAVRALQAGADLLYVPGDTGNQDAAYAAVLAAVRQGRVTRARLDEALGRVAELKRRFAAPPPAVATPSRRARRRPASRAGRSPCTRRPTRPGTPCPPSRP